MTRKRTKEEQRDTVLLDVSAPAQSRSQQADRSGFVERTRASWQQRTTRVLTAEDARQIVENTVGFFDLLQRWDDESGARDELGGAATEASPEEEGEP